ncbi:peptidase S8/S53 domain-containing protein [Mycena belliarum]|uniref:Peptidase S8/S53 domain-containing protein n=1 Tax=Mycena belliarum TaxID=1033014 RepID=A0AAD6TYX7_9AGAR|nr:peptidase S8/S53 domain-containing protein [Mycena belliae]
MHLRLPITLLASLSLRVLSLPLQPHLSNDVKWHNTSSHENRISRRRTGATWNLARISQDGPVSQGKSGAGHSSTSTDWTYFLEDKANGKNVVVYVVDTGVKASHPELANRVMTVPLSYIPESSGGNTDDIDGHGTAVAGVIAGLTVGVANAVEIIPIKIMAEYYDHMTDTGSHKSNILEGTLEKGITLATNHFVKERGRRGSAIINISITAWKDPRLNLDNAIKMAISQGIHVVIAAGNNGDPTSQGYLLGGGPGGDVCNIWVPNYGQISVGATDIHDKMAHFSNFGKCVDVYAPGESIVTASLDGKLAPIDGTSFAAPHVAGMIAAIR